MERGEVWLVALPFGPGREQQGHRPSAVLQDESHGRGSPLVLVVPLTSHLAALRFPATVRRIRANTRPASRAKRRSSAGGQPVRASS